MFENLQVTPDKMTAFAGIAISLLMSYTPGLNARYAALSGDWKRMIQLGLIVLAAVGIMVTSCQGWYHFVTCTPANVENIVWSVIMAAIANQTAYQLTPQPQAVIEAKQ